MMTLLTVIATAFAVGSLAAAVAMAINNRTPTQAEDRLAAMASVKKSGAADGTTQNTLMLIDEPSKNWLNDLLSEMPGLGVYLAQANVKMSPAQFMSICVGLLVAGIVVTIVLPVPILLAPLSGLLLASLPVGWLMFKRKRRLNKFGNQMPEALELLSRSLRAGHSLASGFNLISKELDEPISIEFGRAFEEQNLGISLEDALEGMTRRIPNLDLRFFATAIVLQRTTGGDLAEILGKISHLVRDRIQIYGQVQALTGEGRLSGIVLLALPPVLFLVMLYLNPDYVLMLFTHPMGRKMAMGGLVMQFLGAIAIKKIITIKV